MNEPIKADYDAINRLFGNIGDSVEPQPVKPTLTEAEVDQLIAEMQKVLNR